MKTLTLLAAAALLISCQEKTVIKETVKEETIVEKHNAEIQDGKVCFLKVISRDSISIDAERKGDSISGVFKWNPYEKDSKTINFKGRLVGNAVTAIGTTSAEGMTYQEELIFSLTDTTASVKFGEMIEGDNGVWMYKSKSTSSEEVLLKINCK